METCQLAVPVRLHTDTWQQGFSKTFVIGWKWGRFWRLIRVSHHGQLAALGSQPVFSHILCEHLGSLEQQLEPMLRGRQCLFRMPRLLSPVIADLCLRPLPEVLSCRNPCPKNEKALLTAQAGLTSSMLLPSVADIHTGQFSNDSRCLRKKKINQLKICHYLANVSASEERLCYSGSSRGYPHFKINFLSFYFKGMVLVVLPRVYYIKIYLNLSF